MAHIGRIDKSNSCGEQDDSHKVCRFLFMSIWNKLPSNKWSWDYDKCINCGTSSKEGRHKHESLGLCRFCYKRAENQRLKSTNYWTTSEKWKRYMPRKNKMLRYRRIIKDWFKNPNKKLIKKQQGLSIVIEQGFRFYKVITPIKPLEVKDKNFEGKDGYRIAEELELFKAIFERYLKNHSVNNSTVDR